MFRVNGVEWRMAKHLEVGQQIRCLQGGQSVDHIKMVSSAKAYSLVVTEFSTYFAGKLSGSTDKNTHQKPTLVLIPGLKQHEY